jgi:hypothetical protein
MTVPADENSLEFCSLTSIAFPASLQFIGVDCFTGCSTLSRLSFESGASLQRMIAGVAMDAFLLQIGIDAMIGKCEVEVGEADINWDSEFDGWTGERCEGRMVRYVPEYQRYP